MKINRLVLGSQSSFRQALLRSTGVVFSAVSSPADEKAVHGKNPKDLAARRAEAKGAAVALMMPDALVIGADQVLEFQGEALHKAENAEEAAATLQRLSGQTHYLHSAFCLMLLKDGKPYTLREQVVSVPMTMRSLTHEEIEAYIATGEWRGCVGCYRYEETGINLMQRVDGSASAIIGLPLLELLQTLRDLGVNVLLHPAGPWRLSSR